MVHVTCVQKFFVSSRHQIGDISLFKLPNSVTVWVSVKSNTGKLYKSNNNKYGVENFWIVYNWNGQQNKMVIVLTFIKFVYCNHSYMSKLHGYKDCNTISKSRMKCIFSNILFFNNNVKNVIVEKLDCIHVLFFG